MGFHQLICQTILLLFNHHRWTYRELLAAVDRMAGGLARLGVRRGERVLRVLPNCPEFVIAFLAIQHLDLGAILLSELTANAPARPPTLAANPDSVAVLQATGGTTGTLKLARLTHRSLLAGFRLGNRQAGTGTCDCGAADVPRAWADAPQGHTDFHGQHGHRRYLRRMSLLLAHTLRRLPREMFVRTMGLWVKTRNKTRMPAPAAGNPLRSLRPPQVEPAQFRIEAPTLVMAGEFDPIIPSCYAKLI